MGVRAQAHLAGATASRRFHGKFEKGSKTGWLARQFCFFFRRLWQNNKTLGETNCSETAASPGHLYFRQQWVLPKNKPKLLGTLFYCNFCKKISLKDCNELWIYWIWASLPKVLLLSISFRGVLFKKTSKNLPKKNQNKNRNRLIN